MRERKKKERGIFHENATELPLVRFPHSSKSLTRKGFSKDERRSTLKNSHASSAPSCMSNAKREFKEEKSTQKKADVAP